MKVRIAPPRTDYYTARGALILVEMIRAHWKSRGHAPGATGVERFQIPNVPNHYGVRSRMVAGRPPA